MRISVQFSLVDAINMSAGEIPLPSNRGLAMSSKLIGSTGLNRKENSKIYSIQTLLVQKLLKANQNPKMKWVSDERALAGVHFS